MGSDHRLGRTTEMQFVCKQCKRAFRKDLAQFEPEDEFCPHCDNHFVVQAKTGSSGARRPATTDEQEDGQDGTASVSAMPEHDVQALLDERMRYDPRLDWVRKQLNAGSAGERIDEGGLVGVLEERQEAEMKNARAARNMDAMLAAAVSAHGASANAGIDDDDLDWS